MKLYNICRGRILRMVIGIIMLFFILAGGASAVTPILDCQGDIYSISSPGEYVIGQNLVGNREYPNHHCIKIASDDVILDGKGHWILGNRHSLIWPSDAHDYYYGIWVAGYKNITIKNVSVKDWKYGISFSSVRNGNIVDSNLWSNEYVGIDLWNSSNITLRNNNAYTYPIIDRLGAYPAGLGFILNGNNDIDISNSVNTKPVYYLFDKKNTVLEGIEAGHLTLAYSSNVTIKNSNFIDGDGIKLLNSTGNRIYHNNFKNNSKTWFWSTGRRETWWIGSYDNRNSNSWDNGYPDGGNYWWNYNGTDSNGDSIGDKLYDISGGAGAKDRYPLMIPFSAGMKGDLNNNGESADAGDLVLMKRASIGETQADSRYDLNNNGQLADAGDLVLMKRASIGEINL